MNIGRSDIDCQPLSFPHTTLFRSLLKLIHGYGSSGKGGRIRTASRKYLLAQQEKGRIAAVVPGERFTIFDETTRRALQQYPHLRQDRDLERENMGVTFIFLRRF